MFPGCTVPHDSKETELESSDQEACPSSGKYARLVPFRPWKCVPRCFSWCGHFRGPCVSFVTTDGFSLRIPEITSRIGISWTSNFDLFFNSMKWPYYQKYVNQINLNHTTLSFTNIWCLRLNFVWCESFLKSYFPKIVALCETNLDDSIIFW